MTSTTSIPEYCKRPSGCMIDRHDCACDMPDGPYYPAGEVTSLARKRAGAAASRAVEDCIAGGPGDGTLIEATAFMAARAMAEQIAVTLRGWAAAGAHIWWPGDPSGELTVVASHAHEVVVRHTTEAYEVTTRRHGRCGGCPQRCALCGQVCDMASLLPVSWGKRGGWRSTDLLLCPGCVTSAAVADLAGAAGRLAAVRAKADFDPWDDCPF